MFIKFKIMDYLLIVKKVSIIYVYIKKFLCDEKKSQ